MSRPYQPPRPRRQGAVRPGRSAPPRRPPARARRLPTWLPLLALLPLLAAGVVVIQGRFGTSPAPIAAPATATAEIAALPATPPRPTLGPSATPVGAATPPGGTTLAAGPTTTPAAGTAAGATAPRPTTAPAPPATPTPGPTGGATLAGAPGSPTNSAPTAAPPRAVAGAQAERDLPYVAYHVQPGDTIRSIASRYGVSAASIAQASGLADPDRLRVGQLLTVPREPGWLYRVQPGETLEVIARRVGLPPADIQAASRLLEPTVRAGDVLLIPDTTPRASK